METPTTIPAERVFEIGYPMTEEEAHEKVKRLTSWTPGELGWAVARVESDRVGRTGKPMLLRAWGLVCGQDMVAVFRKNRGGAVLLEPRSEVAYWRPAGRA